MANQERPRIPIGSSLKIVSAETGHAITQVISKVQAILTRVLGLIIIKKSESPDWGSAH